LPLLEFIPIDTPISDARLRVPESAWSSIVHVEVSFFVLGHWNIQGSLYVRDNTLQESLGLERISTGASNSTFEIRFAFRNCVESQRNRGIGFVEIRNVIHER